MNIEQDDFYNLAERIEDAYSEIDNDVCEYLLESNSDYAEIKDDIIKLQKAFPIIRDILDDEGTISLTSEEHKAFIRYLDFRHELEDMERRQIYFRGHTDNFAYLKLIGAI